MSKDDKIHQVIDRIAAKLDSIQEYMAWTIKAEQRFRVGQHVEWSDKGRKLGFPRRKSAQTGIVKAVDGFSVRVLMRGLKHPRSYHHIFFNPVDGPKLF